jgi:hypothetical protein
MIWAPPSDLSLQQELQHIFFFNKTQNFLDPVTLVRSPTFTKLLSGMIKGSKPDNFKYFVSAAFLPFYLF